MHHPKFAAAVVVCAAVAVLASAPACCAQSNTGGSNSGVIDEAAETALIAIQDAANVVQEAADSALASGNITYGEGCDTLLYNGVCCDLGSECGADITTAEGCATFLYSNICCDNNGCSAENLAGAGEDSGSILNGITTAVAAATVLSVVLHLAA